METTDFIPYRFDEVPEDELRQWVNQLYKKLNGRRTVREFSDKMVSIEVMEKLILTAGTAPSGANKQPWTFCAVNNAELKRKIKEAAEKEEFENYHGRMSEEWLKDLEQFGTNWQKPFLEIAPWLIIVFRKSYDFDGIKKSKNYYVQESVGIACGMLITAIHNAGLVCLTHTPSPMNFLSQVLERPENEKPFLLIPVGYPAINATVPNIKKESLKRDFSVLFIAMTFNLNTPIERVKLPLYNQYGIEVFIKRDDLIHPFISGNKWRKLKYNMLFMQQNGFRKLATFGGAFSNHLIATACAGAIFGYKTLGIVRGNELSQQSNHILRLCYEYGMELRFVSRSEYADKEAIANQLVEEGYFVVPEGGDNDLGIQGCEEILPETTMEFNHVFVPVGTATTLIGVVNSSSTHCIVHGIAALSEADYLAQKIKSKTNRNNWILHTRFSRGGFGKFDDELLRSNLAFTRQTGVLLDPVYTGKMIWASNHLIKEKSIKRGEKVLLIHTGGLTGLLSDKWLKMNL